jgi:hypothetical protein
VKSSSLWTACGVFGAFVVLSAAVANAQEESERRARRMDVVLGGSVSHNNAPNTSSLDYRSLRPGWLTGFTGGSARSLTRSLDLVTEVSILSGHPEARPGSENDSTAPKPHASTAFLMAGPQFTIRKHRLFQPFARALTGGSYRHVTPHRGDAGFATGLGGGLDLAVSPHMAIRAIQYDFLAHTGPNRWSNHHRVSFALVFRFRSSMEAAHTDPR